MNEAQRRVPTIRDVAVAGDLALIGGHPAWFLARLLTDIPGGLAALLGRYRLPVERHADVLRAVDALTHAGGVWQLAHAASTSGSEMGAEVAALVPSDRHDGHDHLLAAKDVAGVLGITDRRVRMLAGQGLLPAHRDPGGRWQFDPAVVAAELKRRTEKAA